MTSPRIIATAAFLALAASASFLHAQIRQQSREGLRLPVYRVAQAQPAPVRAAAPQAKEHPLKPMIAKAEELLKRMEKVEDYSATDWQCLARLPIHADQDSPRREKRPR